MKYWISLLVLIACVANTALAARSVTPKAAAQAARKPAAPAPAKPASAQAPSKGPEVQDEPQIDFLPDTALLARVSDRTIRVHDFRDRYFNSYIEDRPSTDSAGRAEFLHNMVNKEVMALAARDMNVPMNIEDRITLRQHTNATLQNVLYQRVVVDSITITEQELTDTYAQFSYALHLRRIQFEDRLLAERVRKDLVAGRISWKNAVLKYQKDTKAGPDGDLGWVRRNAVGGDFGLKVFALEPGSLSPTLQDNRGFHLVQCVGKRPVDPLAFQGVRRLIRSDLWASKSAPRVEALYRQVRERAEVAYDTTNIRWAAEQFNKAYEEHAPDPSAPAINLGGVTPDFSPADTGRVLARMRSRTFTLGQFMSGYTAITPLLRHPLPSFEPMRFSIDGMLLEPAIAELAIARGIDKDPLTVSMIERKHEELQVQHLFEDSVTSRISITAADRKRYYQDHEKEFVSVPIVRYARLLRTSRAGTDSLLARLKAGESAATIIAADSLLGWTGETIDDLPQGAAGEYEKILFEELRPGQATSIGPDRNGNFLVMQVITYSPTRQMSYEEVESIVDQSVQNQAAEARLKAFLARHRSRFSIEEHGELVARIKLTDPAMDF